ncbi:MAG TPA: DUF1800 domain-containing protein [Verrucomicrobiae bacterium]|nr:DUF1800 domain-containing protein [Verrucomicrobiae bacterium]
MLKPFAAGQWNFTTAAHLINRAGFGAPPDEIEKLASLGIERAVSSLLNYEKIPDSTTNPAWAKPDPERMRKLAEARKGSPDERRAAQKAEQQLQRERILELRGWWLRRMARGPRPFQEKMTLFWHGHFATSVQKVRDAYYMWRQNELFRRLATGNWLEMLIQVAQDPAMLIWLDQAQSRKQHPNENFAREVMELFTLGEGHYTEKDVTEGARALTGWSLNRQTQQFVDRPRIHDEGEKTFLGRTGNFDGKDVLDQIVAQPQAAIFITGKLWNFFAGEPPETELNAALAAEFRRSGNNFKPLLRTMFLSEEFYAPSVIRNQIKSPVQWLVGTTRMLQCELPPPLVSANLLRSLGQDLFAPPNVKGWDGGLAWINTNTLLARYNEAATLVQGDLSIAAKMVSAPGKNPNRAKKIERRMRNFRAGGVNVEKIFTPEERANTDSLVAALEKRLLQAKLKEKQETVLREFLADKENFSESEIRDAIRLVMSTPEYQLT